MSAVVPSLPGIDFRPAERAAVIPRDDPRHAPSATAPAPELATPHRGLATSSVTDQDLAAAAAAAAAVSFEEDPRSLPDSAVFWKIVGRSIRTTGPLVAADVIALALAGLFAQGVLMVLSPPAAQLVGRAAPVALIPLMIGYWLGGLYAELWAHPVLVLRQIAHVNTVALLAVAGASAFSTPGLVFGCVAAWVAAATLVPVVRATARRLCARSAWWGYPTLIIGSARGAGGVARALLNAPVCGLRPVLLTDPTGECRSGVLPVVNDTPALESILRCESIRHAVIYLPEASNAHLSDTVDRYSGLVPHLLVLSDCSALPALWSASRNSGRLSGIEVRNGLLLPSLRIVKRALDLLLTFAAVAVSLPVMLLIAIGVKLTSRGPVFYGHIRIGQRGRRFKAWKFRTMRLNADVFLRGYLARDPAARREWEQTQKLRDDPRVTAFGRFLRRTSLDELPQVWNVLRGEMSLVGPRPIVRDEVWRYGAAIRLYAAVKPGITGLWQVSGRTDTSYAERVLLDEFYVRHWSPWLDLYVLARTVVALVWRSGAY
jgi:Undecaprenyl-phosphate galactose phosphotransferase WbaP